MCWSLEVSVAAGSVAYLTVLYLWRRNKGRDRWNAVFLGVFSTMQWIDGGLWALFRFGVDTPGYPCSTIAQVITITGIGVIILEPIACLLGSCYHRGEWWTNTEFTYYVVLNLAAQFTFGYLTPIVYSSDVCATQGTAGACPHLSPNGHLIYGFAVDKDLGPKCWREFGLFGAPQSEIPLWLRVCFLAGMVYPYLAYSNPLGSGLLQSLILTMTWFVGYFSDSHASVWCLANVMQCITMLADPYLFPPSPQPLSTPVRHKETKSGLSRDLFTMDKAGKAWDFIFVGSGIGSLSCAALLSRAGYRCLVLEQHTTIGGATHEFHNHGNSFDSGIHYVGGSSPIKAMLSYITDAPGVFLAQMNAGKDGLYDEFDMGDGLWVRYRAGRDKVRQELLERFPSERPGIDEYFRRVDSASRSLAVLVLLKALPQCVLRVAWVRRWLLRRMHRDADVTAREAVEACGVSDKRLRALLSAGQLIDWNGLPGETSWSVVGAMAAYYQDGGFYPAGGSRIVARHIIPIIERAGGRVLSNVRVERFLAQDGQIHGVHIEKGARLYARHAVVSDAGLANTIDMIQDDAMLSKAGLQRDMVEKMGLSNGHVTAFVSLDGPPEAFDLRASNIHSWTGLGTADFDPDVLQTNFYRDPLGHGDDTLMTLTAPCVKDPEYARTGSSSVLLLTEGRSEWFKDMDMDAIHRFYAGQQVDPGPEVRASNSPSVRAAKYHQFKKDFEKIFLDRLYKYYPKTKGKVLHIEIGSPLTSAKFLAAKKGGSYGIAWTPKRFADDFVLRASKVDTAIPGLYLTGESALFGGFAGAMGGGYIAALKILGPLRFLKLLLTTETVHAKQVSGSKSKTQSPYDQNSLVVTFLSIILVMLLGQRAGRSLSRVLLRRL